MEQSDHHRFERELERLFARAGIASRADQRAQMARHYAEMCRWNRRINLTRITDPHTAARKHYLDAAVGVAWVRGADTLLDIGSGAGFPGIVLAILLPDTHVRALDASDKRCQFLLHAKRVLGLENLEVRHGRWPEDAPERVARIVSRATFSSLSELEAAASRLTPDGSLVLWRAADAANEALRGFRLQRVAAPISDGAHVLLLGHPQADGTP